MKKLGNGGFLGPTREPDYGGLGLDYSYSIAIAEELGSIRCGGVSMAIGVQSGRTDVIILRPLYIYMTLYIYRKRRNIGVQKIWRFRQNPPKIKYWWLHILS